MQALLDAVSTPRRRAILRLVWEDERTSGEIASHFSASWPSISRSLKELRDAGVITERREGNRRYYAAARGVLRPLRPILKEMWATDLSALKNLAEQEARRR